MRGTAYQQQLSFAGGSCPSCTFALDYGSLPTGLTLSPNGLISGTSTDSGEFDFRVLITDGIQSVRQTYSLIIYYSINGYLSIQSNNQAPDIYQGPFLSISITAKSEQSDYRVRFGHAIFGQRLLAVQLEHFAGFYAASGNDSRDEHHFERISLRNVTHYSGSLCIHRAGDKFFGHIRDSNVSRDRFAVECAEQPERDGARTGRYLLSPRHSARDLPAQRRTRLL